MAQVNTIDVTTLEGSADFPLNVNDVYGLVETIAVQNIRAVKSTNKIVDGFYDYDVVDGKVIQEAVIEMAKEQAFEKNSYAFAPKDPTLWARHFNNYEDKQFQTTVRRNDIRKIIANKGTGLGEIVGNIINSITEGEGYYDFKKMREVYFNGAFKDYTTYMGGKPKNMKGVLYALRDAYNHLKSTNSDMTADVFASATPEEDIRIAITTKLLNLIDVVELANIFNLQKEELFGKIVVVDVDDLTEKTNWYKAWIYDKKACGRATRLYEYSQDVIGKGLYTNHYLTVDRAYFHNGLFKSAVIDCTDASNTALAEIITPNA